MRNFRIGHLCLLPITPARAALAEPCKGPARPITGLCRNVVPSPRETRDHVPKVYAAILMANDPEFYGLQVTQLPPYVYDESIMEANTDLRLVADLSGLTLEEIRELNPHIMAWVPEGYPVRIPSGSQLAFENALAEVPKAERIAFLSHVVASGDTLSEIAGIYGTRQSRYCGSQ